MKISNPLFNVDGTTINVTGSLINNNTVVVDGTNYSNSLGTYRLRGNCYYNGTFKGMSYRFFKSIFWKSLWFLI